MASSEAFIEHSDESTYAGQEEDESLNSSGETAIVGDDSWEAAEDDVASVSSNLSRKSCTFAERRQLPSRASKETSMLGIKRRTIMKPTKRSQSKHKDFNNLKPADIRKIYLNKKLTKFRPSSLETIFEEPLPSQSDAIEELENVRLIGARKIRRSLSCSDGFKLNKTLVNKRRAKIKKTFGRRFALKKISLEEFLDKLNSSMESSDITSNQSDHSMMAEGISDQQPSSSEPINTNNLSL